MNMKAKELREILDNSVWNFPQPKWQEWAKQALAALDEPKCQPKPEQPSGELNKVMGDMLDTLLVLNGLNTRVDGSHETKDLNIETNLTNLHNQWVELKCSIEQIEAEKAKAEVLIEFYLEGLEKSGEEIKQLTACIKELKANENKS